MPTEDGCTDGTEFIGTLSALLGVQKVETNLSNVILNSNNNTKKILITILAMTIVIVIIIKIIIIIKLRNMTPNPKDTNNKYY